MKVNKIGYIMNDIEDRNKFWTLWQNLYPFYREIYPTMNSSFYENMIKKNLTYLCKNISSLEIMICGAADEDTLKLLNSILKTEYGAKFNITLLDFCQIAIERNKKYSYDNDLEVNFVHQDILKYEESNRFDIIISDGFIDYFNKEEKEEVLKKWKTILKSNGVILTTIPIEHTKKSLSIGFNKYALLFVKALNKGYNPILVLILYNKLKKASTVLTIKYGENKAFLSSHEFFKLCTRYNLEVVHFERFYKYKCPHWYWYNCILKKSSNGGN